MQEPVTVSEQLLRQVVDRLDAINTKLERLPDPADGLAPGGNVTPKPGPPGKKKPSPRAKSVDGL